MALDDLISVVIAETLRCHAHSVSRGGDCYNFWFFVMLASFLLAAVLSLWFLVSYRRWRTYVPPPSRIEVPRGTSYLDDDIYAQMGGRPAPPKGRTVRGE